ncbi:hypothetical protein [Phenylobacterium sp.]|uniref:hypothetical protein n=1 Tax=Phenylobacterium sp. TaxID=1871053 RepID=UPI002736A3E6|nr:hypothetical protein [Phenylobacterium sp.]MDP3855596.1 hypothetical protein [Phenylobacterium sp.]
MTQVEGELRQPAAAARPPVYLSAIGTALGAPCAARDLQLGGRETLLATLIEDGFHTHRRHQGAMDELIARALRQALDRWPGAAASIDVILYASTRISPADADTVSAACRAEGLSEAALIGLGFGGCANLATAIHVAQALVRAGAYSTVAVITADRGSDDDRVAAMDQGVLSDGASACIVAAKPGGPESFEILGTATRGHQGLREIDFMARRPHFLMTTAKAVRGATRAALSQAGVEVGDIEGFITANIQRTSVQFYGDICRIAPERWFPDSKADLGHSFGTDLLENLRRARQNPHRRGPWLVLAVSPYLWGALVITPLQALDARERCSTDRLG